MSPRTLFRERVGQWPKRKQGYAGEQRINARAARRPRGSERALASYGRYMQPLRAQSIAYVHKDLPIALRGSANKNRGSVGSVLAFSSSEQI
jgi:hypothetical protein